jgi:hypothetical protein
LKLELARPRFALKRNPEAYVFGTESGKPVKVFERMWRELFTLREYLDKVGRSPFGRWFDDLDATAAARVTIALARIEQGDFSNVKGVGAGFFEYRISKRDRFTAL